MREAIDKLKVFSQALRREVHVLALARRDPRTPKYARWLIIAAVVYALSPIDLIPDFIPVFGLLDDLIVVPLLILAARALIPAGLLAELREAAVNPPDKTP